MPSKVRLPHLPRNFGPVIELNGVDVSWVKIGPVYPKISHYLNRGHALKKSHTHLPLYLWPVLELNGVDVSCVKISLVYPKISTYLNRGLALKKAPTPPTPQVWSCFRPKWDRRKLCQNRPRLPQNIKVFKQRPCPQIGVYPTYPAMLVLL